LRDESSRPVPVGKRETDSSSENPIYGSAPEVVGFSASPKNLKVKILI
jgi:hypothetical protein